MSADAVFRKSSETAPGVGESSKVFWASVPEQRSGSVSRDSAPDLLAPRVVETLSVRLNPMTAREIVNEIILCAVTGERLLLANHNLHSLYLYQKHEAVRAFYGLADKIVIDGAPILWLASRKNGELGSEYRVGSTDWLALLLPLAVTARLKIGFLGGEPGVAERARNAIVSRFPTLQLCVHDGYFDATPGSPGSERVLSWLEEEQPDVLLVGMGMPRQERWIADNYSRLKATVVCPVGGCFDYIAGNQRLAPRWLGRFGLEWAYRLLCDPARLWQRYLLEPPLVLTRCLRQSFSDRRRGVKSATDATQ